MYSVAQMSVGVGGVGAYRAPTCYCSSRIATTCRVSEDKGRMQDVRFRVSPPMCLDDLQVGFARDRGKLQLRCRAWGSFGLIPRRRVCCNEDLSTRSGRRLRAHAPGDVGLVTETVREVSQGEYSDAGSGFVEEAEVADDVVALGFGWKVREASRLDIEELRAVAHMQASSFHVEAAVFDELFFNLFKAEVLSALLYKGRHSPSDRYTCLLAEPATSIDQGESGDGEFAPMIVGAVNLAASVDNEVLRHLHSADEYLYVSGMAVDINYRRKNVATLLLRACELLAMKWGFDYLALHAYEDDMAARTLYSRGGYRVVALDPSWMSTWVGRKKRVLMAKRTSRTPNLDF